MRPMRRDVLEDLEASRDLDPALLAAMPTFALYGTVVEWKRAEGFCAGEHARAPADPLPR